MHHQHAVGDYGTLFQVDGGYEACGCVDDGRGGYGIRSCVMSCAAVNP